MDFCGCGSPTNYWWGVILMVGNEWAGWMVANEGCFYWGWFVACDLQIFLFVPWFVYLLEFKLKNHKIIADLIILLLICGGTAITFYIIYHND